VTPQFEASLTDDRNVFMMQAIGVPPLRANMKIHSFIKVKAKN
jgi:hypothetical protein